MPQTMTRMDLSLKRREIVDSQKWYWFDRIGWGPHRHQILMHQSLARERWEISGRRGGKSESIGHEASAYMVSGPFNVLLLGPTYDDTYKEFRVVMRDVLHEANPHRGSGMRVLDNKQAGSLYIKLPNGAFLEGKSAGQPTRSPIIGEEYDLMVLCEAAKIAGLGGEGGLWETQLQGNLTSRLGDLLGGTTPAGKDDFLYPRVLKGLSGTDPDIWAHQFPAFANPNYPEDVNKQRKNMSERAFREQVLGEFVSWSGAIWLEDCGFAPETHTFAPFRVPAYWNRVEVIDPGFSDYFAWIAAVKDEDDNLYGVDEFRTKKTRYKDLARMIIQHRIAMYGDDYKEVGNRTRVYVDPEDPRCRAEISAEAREMDEVIRCFPADNNVFAGFEAGSVRFRTNTAFLFNTLFNSIDALSNHEWQEGLDTKGRHREKRDEYKHFSDLWRYLMLAHIRPSKKPERVANPNTWTYRDLYNSLQPSAGLFGSSFGKFKQSFGNRV